MVDEANKKKEKIDFCFCLLMMDFYLNTYSIIQLFQQSDYEKLLKNIKINTQLSYLGEHLDKDGKGLIQDSKRSNNKFVNIGPCAI